MSTVLSDTDVRANVAANLQRILADRSITRTALAAMTGDPLMTISTIVAGKHVPSAALLARIAEALDVSIDRLVSSPAQKFSAVS